MPGLIKKVVAIRERRLYIKVYKNKPGAKPEAKPLQFKPKRSVTAVFFSKMGSIKR